ncbi:MAG TPA: ABC transporter permease [Caldilineaceae bacterium]|nr:ABC transporter permease [Caldilineaceae bacterium]
MNQESTVLPQYKPAGDVADQVEERLSVASQRQLMWMRFKRHRLALAAAVVVLLFYLVALGAEFLATSDPRAGRSARAIIPPQPVYLFDGGEFRLHVCGVKGERDAYTMQKIYKQDCSRKIDLQLFAQGFEYEFLGLIPSNRHLLGVRDPETDSAEETIFLLGTDTQGRDLYSRIIYGTRTSMTIGLIGVTLSLALGIALGGVSGFFGGVIDNIIQRTIEIIRSIPTIPLWMGLAAALPPDWSILQIYFAITVIVSLFAWTDLARVVRGRFLAMREEDFVTAALVTGATWQGIIFRHMVPSFYSHLIASATLAIPFMIISETALSFLGLGLRPPAISWGVLLQATQNVQAIALTPWLMLPAVPVIVAILALNFMGDGLRDAADPYS